MHHVLSSRLLDKRLGEKHHLFLLGWDLCQTCTAITYTVAGIQMISCGYILQLLSMNRSSIQGSVLGLFGGFLFLLSLWRILLATVCRAVYSLCRTTFAVINVCTNVYCG